MRAYWELAKGGYRRYARYRTAIAASLIDAETRQASLA